MDTSFAERAVVNHRDFLTNGLIVTSTAINITENEVLTADGRHIGYDYLVVATGHSDNVPVTKTERLHHNDAGKKKLYLLYVVTRVLFSSLVDEHNASLRISLLLRNFNTARCKTPMCLVYCEYCYA